MDSTGKWIPFTSDTTFVETFSRHDTVYIHDTIYKWKKYIPKGYYHYSILDVDTANWNADTQIIPDSVKIKIQKHE